MKSDKKILTAFLLNLIFSIFEMIGGAFSGSIAIISDAVHDLGDALSIGCSYFLERKSKKKPDRNYTYGYLRYSVLGAALTNGILVVGSLAVIYNAVLRIINPVEVDDGQMIIFAVVGVAVNLLALLVTRDGHSLNQKGVSLHMLEDALGWIAVLVGAVVIKLTGWVIIDPLMSIGVAIFILISALKGSSKVVELFLEKTPDGIDTDEIREHICHIDGVVGVHHIHVRSVDGYNNYATLHVVSNIDSLSEFKTLKREIKEELHEHGIAHATVELEAEGEDCGEIVCHPEHHSEEGHHHHHHHHHHH